MTDPQRERKSESWIQRLLRTDTDETRTELTQVRADLERALLEVETASVALRQQTARAAQLEAELVAKREQHDANAAALEHERAALVAANDSLATRASEIASLRAAEEREQRRRKYLETQRNAAVREREGERASRVKKAQELGLALARCDELEAAMRAFDAANIETAKAHAAQLESMNRTSEEKDRALAHAEARCRALEVANVSLAHRHKVEFGKRTAELENKQKELVLEEARRAELETTIRSFQDERNEWSTTRAEQDSALRRLLDEQDVLATQRDNLQLELVHKEQERVAEREQWALLSQRFWKALERLLGDRAAMALSRTPRSDAPTVITFSDLAFSKVKNSFAMLGLCVDVTATELSPGSIEMRLSGPSVARAHGVEPRWLSAIALSYLESACECSLSVHQLERSGDDLLLRFVDRSSVPPVATAARRTPAESTNALQ